MRASASTWQLVREAAASGIAGVVWLARARGGLRVAGLAGLSMCLTACWLSLGVGGASAASGCRAHPWCNGRLAPGKRAAMVLAAISTAEKLALVSSGKASDTRLGIPRLLGIDGPNGVARLDDMSRRILSAMFAVGLFGHPVRGGARRHVSTRAHLGLATRVAEQATVLLRNRHNVLPLSPRVGSIGVIGHDAGPGTQIEENGSPAVLHGPVITPLAGIRRLVGHGRG